MMVTAWHQVTPSTIEACFRKCLEDPNVEIEPVPVPADFTRSAWESQIDLEAFTEEEIELEIQEIIQKNQSMAPDPAEPEKENLMTTSVAMTATRRLRSYFQCHSAPLEILQALAQVESQLLKDKIESKTAKQTTIKNFFVKPTGLPIQPQQQQNTPEKQQNNPEQQQSPHMSTKKCQQEPLQQSPPPDQLQPRQQLPTTQQSQTRPKTPPAQQQQSSPSSPPFRGWTTEECKPERNEQIYYTDEEEFEDLNGAFFEPPSVVVTPKKRKAD